MADHETRVLVCGVAVLDFVFNLDEMPRTAEKFRANSASIVGGGGAANGAVGISRLGGKAHLACRIGDDVLADLIVRELLAEGVDCQLVRRFAGRQSSFSSIFIDGQGERQIVNFRDMDISFDADWIAAGVPDGLKAVLADTRWPQGAGKAMEIARERGIPGVLDVEAPASESLEAIALASHAAFSAQGLRDMTAESGLAEGLLKLRELPAMRSFDGWAGVTDGGQGVFYLEGNSVVHVPAFAVHVVDTLGAGDLWHAAFALRLAEGADVKEAIVFANAAAAIKCTRHGGRLGMPDREETEAFLRARNA
ncbi:MAG: PfkB family carbohydrate kinase [Rhizobiaceae bacterium]